MSRSWIAAASAGAALLLTALPAAAQQGHKFFYPHGFMVEERHTHEWTGRPSLSVELELELEFDRTYNPSSSRRNQLYSESEAEITLQLTEELSIEGSIALEPVRDDDGNQYFKDHAVFLEQLFLAYRTGGLMLFGGKFNPHFGIAWRAAPGVFAADFAEDYEFTERVGVGAAYTLDEPEIGEHRFIVSTFFADTTGLSNSIITRPKFGDPFAERFKRNRKDYGGPSNTESLSSFTAVLEGGAMPFLGNLTYHLGYSNQKPGEDGTKREIGYAAALTYNWFLGQNLSFHPMVEYVKFNNFGGNLLNEEEGGEARGTDDDRQYVTLGMRTQLYKNWNWSIAHTWRKIDLDGVKQPTERLLSTSVGYRFDFGLSIDVGWKRDETEGQVEKVVGILAKYKYEF